MIIGHQSIQERLYRSIDSGIFAQTQLFFGPESVGKFVVAKECARRLIGAKRDEAENATHPDLLVLEPAIETVKGSVKEKPIGIDAVHEAIRFVQTFPYSSKRKVLIVRDAHRLNESAQNALLKTLEEPLPHAFILLVTHQSGKLLPTVISRCRSVSFGLVSLREMEEFFQTQAPSLSKIDRFAKESGRPGLTPSFSAQGENLAKHWELFESLGSLDTLLLRDRLAVAEQCAKDTSATIRVLSWRVSVLHTEALMSDEGNRFQKIRFAGEIERLRLDLERFPASARALLDAFVLHWNEV